LASEWKQVRVEWLSGNGEGHEWYPADLSSTDRPHHKVSAHNGLTINLPVYKLVYPSDEKSYHVVFLSKTCLVDIDDKEGNPFYQFCPEGHWQTQSDDMPFDCKISLKCKDDTEMTQFIARCMQTTLLKLEVAVVREDHTQFVDEIQRITDEVVEGLIQFKRQGDPENTQGYFGIGHQGTAIVTADKIIEILKELEDDNSDDDDEGV